MSVRVCSTAVRLTGATDQIRRELQCRAATRHGLLTSSHRKNGPPISAVMTPTGSSTGAMTVRDSTSQPTRNAAPKSADAGSTRRWSAADQQPHQVRHDDADEADRSADRHGGAGGERRAEERDAAARATTSRPRVSALSAPRLSRFSGRASQANDRERDDQSGSAVEDAAGSC